jgi:hypothetical protein
MVASSPWNKKSSLVKKNNFPKEQWILLGERPKFLGPKGTFPEERCIFLGERPKFPKKPYILNHFAITTISCLFIYSLTTYLWKGLEESYNFVIQNISIKIHMQKLQLNKILNTFVTRGTWLLPGQLKPLLPMYMVKLLLPKDMIVP